MLSLFSILFGASFPLAAAYALGSFCPRRMKLPATVVLATGAALLSLVVFLLMAAARGPPPRKGGPARATKPRAPAVGRIMHAISSPSHRYG